MKWSKRGLLLTIVVILLGAAPRLWDLKSNLQIHFDQGLHALETWNIYHQGKFTLLGHMTDTAGIFHGPIYYWLMTPAYFLGGGDPAAASIFQVALSLIGVLFLADLARGLFGEKTAIISASLYSLSYGYISYARWLSNVTPTLPISIMFFWLAWKVYNQNLRALPVSALLVSLITQLDGAIGIFLYPVLLWLIIKIHRHLKLRDWVVTLIAASLPHWPQLLFELRHNWVVTKSVLNFSANSGQGIGLSANVAINNLQLLYLELVKLTSWPIQIPVIVLGIAGLIALWRWRYLPAVKFVFLSSLIFILSLSLYQRGAIMFFLIPVWGLVTIAFAWVLTKFPKWLTILFLTVILATNLFHWQDFLIPSFALTPIGTFNLITNQDRKRSVDWIYRQADGKPFALWIYTIPYYLDQPWIYYFDWYGKSKYGYLPIKTGGFSPGDIDAGTLIFDIYEPDDNRPQRLQSWLQEVENNFGPTTATFASNDARVEQRGKMRP